MNTTHPLGAVELTCIEQTLLDSHSTFPPAKVPTNARCNNLIRSEPPFSPDAKSPPLKVPVSTVVFAGALDVRVSEPPPSNTTFSPLYNGLERPVTATLTAVSPATQEVTVSDCATSATARSPFSNVNPAGAGSVRVSLPPPENSRRSPALKAADRGETQMCTPLPCHRPVIDCFSGGNVCQRQITRQRRCPSVSVSRQVNAPPPEKVSMSPMLYALGVSLTATVTPFPCAASAVAVMLVPTVIPGLLPLALSPRTWLSRRPQYWPRSGPRSG